jgi:glycosyltransferase involved in cell wall biosynthesis
MNTVHIDEKYKQKNAALKRKKIGVYASGDRWVKNFYNQLAGVSLLDGYTADVIPLSEKTKEFANILKLKVSGSGNVSRQEMYKRLSSNDVNIYVTFVECAPIIPLESLELGVPCITSNNHHYWENTELEKYLVLDKCEDPQALSKRIKLCIENKDIIIKLYKKWKKEYDIECEKNNKNFLI